MIKVGINGFGRIGRLTMRTSAKRQKYKIVAINDLVDSVTSAHLLKYDSVYGIFGPEVKADDTGLIVDGERILVFSERDPSRIPWGEEGVNVVIEATGRFRSRDAAGAHLKAGAQKVIITAPGSDLDFTVVLGVNENNYQPREHHLISNASCTTNALALVVKVLYQKFGLKKGLMNTTHAYTNDQQLLDLAHPDLRRARAAGLSMIPTSTGAARTVGVVIPELKGKIDGFAIRVPSASVSLVDFVAELGRETTADEINQAFKQAAQGSPFLAYSEEPLVSIDFKGNSHSSTVDGPSTMVIGGNLARVIAWYDNEWAYSCRVADLVELLADHL